MNRPFEGLRVLDATHILAGPYCTYLLGLLGAAVIKVENPREPDPVRGRGPVPALNEAGLGFNYLVQGSNKRSLTLDLKSEAGRAIFLKLAAEADVVVENWRAGAFPALGLGYDDIRAINPDVVYCSLTAFGQDGPWAQATAYDPTVQAFSGIMQRTGAAMGVPVMPGAPFIDYGAGLNAAFAIASALFHRQRSGEGQYIDCAMLDLALVMTGPALVADDYQGEKVPLPVDAGTSCYRAKDGWLQLGAYNFRQSKRLWTALGRPDLAAIDSWPALWAATPQIRAALEALMPSRTCDEWEDFLREIRVPGARVRSLPEAIAIPQVAARGLLQELPAMEGTAGVRVPGAPFAFAKDGPAIDRPPPRLGQHTDEILAELGYDAQAIAALHDDGTI
jgi:crotonobetainyl-CoA:carnitine CoA-transferase CaiB-like acyl-CoA transferase